MGMSNKSPAHCLCTAYRSAINSGLTGNAVFAAERIVACARDSASLALLAHAHSLDNPRTAHSLQSEALLLCTANQPLPSIEVAVRYSLARTCFQLDLLNEAEDCLRPAVQGLLSLRASSRESSPISEVDALLLSYSPDDSAVYCLMGLICKKASTFSLAQKYLVTAIELNPFSWVAFEALCDIGVTINPDNYFTDSAAGRFMVLISKLDSSKDENSCKAVTDSVAADAAPRSALSQPLVAGPVTRRGRSTLMNAPAAAITRTSTVEKRDTKRTKLSSIQQQSNQHNLSRHILETSDSHSQSIPVSESAATKIDHLGSDSLFSDIMITAKTLAQAYYHYRQFNCAEAIRLCRLLPQHDIQTGRVSVLIARCYFEMAEYKMAEEWFLKARAVDPHQLTGMDIYSSTLWHLRKEVELSHLAHELVETHRTSPEAWCAVGNCFSLKREHDVALKCFNRAAAMNDGSFTYAHTLTGHEYVSMENNEKAMTAFRLAVRGDKRHYNAWFGIGYIYLSQEKYDLAEFHFKRALEINCSNPILILYMGLVAEKQNRSLEALAAYKKAHSLRPDVPLYAFRQATVLLHLHRHKEALQVLEPLSAADPCESGVHFLLGKIYARMKTSAETRGLAIRAFTMAQDVAHGKVANLIKEEIEKMIAAGETVSDAAMEGDDVSVGDDEEEMDL
ncbi:anaphase-promoting complex subunit cdc27 [Chytriomyces hyalinus]|nr:anaphase-promoting complex subunit cdc27 [Chytriomyces hyalinus]